MWRGAVHYLRASQASTATPTRAEAVIATHTPVPTATRMPATLRPPTPTRTPTPTPIPPTPTPFEESTNPYNMSHFVELAAGETMRIGRGRDS